MKELVNLPLEHQLNHTDTTFSKNENDIVFKELSGAKFHHGGSFKKDSPKWIVVHYTAVAGASAYSCTKSYSKTSRKVSTHFFCDSQDVYRVVDEKHIAWHVGSGKIPCPVRGVNFSNIDFINYGDRENWCFKLAAEEHTRWENSGVSFKGNSDSFSVDICCIKGDKSTNSVKDQDWDFNPKAIINAAKTVAYLCSKYNIDIDHVIRHADVTGKPCPRPFVSLIGDKDPNLNNKRWESFKQLVATYI